LGPSLKLRQLVLKKGAVPTIEPHYGTLQTGNWTKNDEKQVNNARRTAGELLGHFPSKIRLVVS